MITFPNNYLAQIAILTTFAVLFDTKEMKEL